MVIVGGRGLHPLRKRIVFFTAITKVDTKKNTYISETT